MRYWKDVVFGRQLLQLLLITFFGLAMLAAPSLAAMLRPISTTGHDQDIIYESGLAAGATGANGELGSRQFFEDGATSPTDDGLPRTLPTFTSTLTGDTIDFAFQPFKQNNVLKFDAAAAPKSLALVTPQSYRGLAVVFSGGSLATSTEVAVVNYTINYVGGMTQSGTLNVPDWGAAPMPAGTEELFNADRTTANATTWPVTSDNNTTAGRWSINVSQITTDHPNLEIESVLFGPITLNGTAPLNSGDDVVIYGLSGVPEPSAGLLALFSALVLGGCHRRRG